MCWYASGVWLADDTYGTGQHGCQYSNAGPLSPGLPQNAPVLPKSQLVGPDDTIVQAYAPSGLRVPAPTDITTVRLFRIRHGLLFINGVRSFNAPGEVEVVRLTVGDGADISRNVTPFDSAAFNTEKCFCPVDWGCSDEVTITLRGLVPDAELNWVVFGTLMQSFDSCYPTLGTVEAHAAGLWGMMNGRDPCAPDTLHAWRNEHQLSPRVPNMGRKPRSATARAMADRVRHYLSRT